MGYFFNQFVARLYFIYSLSVRADICTWDRWWSMLTYIPSFSVWSVSVVSCGSVDPEEEFQLSRE